MPFGRSSIVVSERNAHRFPGRMERVVMAVHARQKNARDQGYEREFAQDLSARYTNDGLIELYGRFMQGQGIFDQAMRRIIWLSVTASCGSGLRVEAGVGFKHPETFQIGNGVFIGSQAYIQGRFDGSCRIGDGVWIGPHSYFDARDLVLGNHVGWGPGAKVLGSTHTGDPVDVPVIETDLVIKPVRVDDWADIGTGAVLMPGVNIGKGAIVGAGAVVTHDVPAFAKVAGIPAKIMGWRDDHNARP